MIRTITVWAWISLVTVMLGFLAFITFPFDRRGNMVHRYARLWGWLIIKVSGCPVMVRGLEHVPSERPCIFMCNHMGSFDIFALLAYLPVQFRWLAKAELFRIPIMGWAMRTAGYISLDRAGRRRAYESIERAARTIRKGTSVVIFPEGSRSPDGGLYPFMKGGFTLAIKAQVPIVPVAIQGSWEIMPRDRLRVCKGAIRIVVDRPVETDGLTMKDRDRLMNQVEKIIRSNVGIDNSGCMYAA